MKRRLKISKKAEYERKKGRRKERRT